MQAAGKSLDRSKLLDILIEAPNEDRLNALVSMTRPGLDYLFFQSLTERIEKKTGDDRKKLENLRQKLLEITHLIDQRAEEEYKHASSLFDTILAAENIEQATTEHIEEINDAFIQVLNRALQDANQKNDSVMMPKLQKIVGVLQKVSAPPPELALLEELLDAPDEILAEFLAGKALKGNHSRVQFDHCQCSLAQRGTGGRETARRRSPDHRKTPRPLPDRAQVLNAEEYEIIKKSPLQSIAAGIFVYTS